MIKKIITRNIMSLLVFIIPFLFPLMVKAVDEIPINCSIDNIKKGESLTIKYDIVPDSSNNSGVTGEPSEVTLTISKDDNIVDKHIDKKIYIDFSKTTYSMVGTYKYIIKENSIDNNEDYSLTNKEYEIYIQVIYDKDGNMIKNVYLVGKDLLDNQKKPISFNYVNTTEERDISNVPITGASSFVLPIAIFIILFAIFFIVYGKIKQND